MTGVQYEREHCIFKMYVEIYIIYFTYIFLNKSGICSLKCIWHILDIYFNNAEIYLGGQKFYMSHIYFSHRGSYCCQFIHTSCYQFIQSFNDTRKVTSNRTNGFFPRTPSDITLSVKRTIRFFVNNCHQSGLPLNRTYKWLEHPKKVLASGQHDAECTQLRVRECERLFSTISKVYCIIF